MYFEKSTVVTKHGVETRWLKAQFQNLNVTAIVKFLEDLLPNIAFYRNHLHHYRHCYKELNEMFKRCASVDIYFSENLTVPVKFEPQSLHWCHQQVTVHSGILRCNGEKNYIAHFSDDRKHDQLFVDVVKNIIGNADLTSTSNILIQSDKCNSQYKSAHHFSHLQKIANRQQKQVLRLWSIAGHGKWPRLLSNVPFQMIFSLKTFLTCCNTFLKNFQTICCITFKRLMAKHLKRKGLKIPWSYTILLMALQHSKQLSLQQTVKPSKQLLVFVCVTAVYPGMVLAKCLRHTSFIALN